MGTLWNTYAFYILYADIDAYSPFDSSWPAPAYTGHGPLRRASFSRWCRP